MGSTGVDRFSRATYLSKRSPMFGTSSTILTVLHGAFRSVFELLVPLARSFFFQVWPEPTTTQPMVWLDPAAPFRQLGWSLGQDVVKRSGSLYTFCRGVRIFRSSEGPAAETLSRVAVSWVLATLLQKREVSFLVPWPTPKSTLTEEWQDWLSMQPLVVRVGPLGFRRPSTALSLHSWGRPLKNSRLVRNRGGCPKQVPFPVRVPWFFLGGVQQCRLLFAMRLTCKASITGSRNCPKESPGGACVFVFRWVPFFLNGWGWCS